MTEIVVLSGAGLSAESGLGTFRDEGGLWSEYDLNEVATPEGFARDPALVHRFYNARRANAQAAAPNPAHHALVRLEQALGDRVLLVTQNVDDLLERAGAQRVLHMHGALSGAVCAACEHRWPAPATMAATDKCPACGATATRPDVVWFGEIPKFLDTIAEALERCQRFTAIGTSGSVYPAAAFVQEAAFAGAKTLELNLEASAVASDFDEVRLGAASQLTPAWVEEVLAEH